MKTTYKNLQITSLFKGDKPANWGGAHENYNNHLIKVKNIDTGKRIQFEFWASIAHPLIETESSLLSAFDCFVNDALSGKLEFDDFYYELGYDTDSRKAESIHKACIKSLGKFENIIDDDIYDFANELQELVNA